jgi:hypothetical protein
MKDNHHVTQNQTVKININTGSNKPSKRRNKPQQKLGGLGGGGGGGGGGGFSVPPIIHNDNKPDTSAIEDTLNKQENSLQRIYDNQMTQHHYSNFIRDGYAHYPQIDAPHFTRMMMGDRGDREPNHQIENRVEEVDDSDDDSDGEIGGADAGGGEGAGGAAAGGEDGEGVAGSGAGGGGGGWWWNRGAGRDEEPPPSPPFSVQKALNFGTPKPLRKLGNYEEMLRKELKNKLQIG